MHNTHNIQKYPKYTLQCFKYETNLYSFSNYTNVNLYQNLQPSNY